MSSTTIKHSSTHEYITLTPPFKPLSKVPFPLPPAKTCALMTMSSPPEFSCQCHSITRSDSEGCPHRFALLSSPLLRQSGQLRLSVHQRHTTSSESKPIWFPGCLLTVFSRLAERYSWIDRKRFCCSNGLLAGACFRLLGLPLLVVDVMYL